MQSQFTCESCNKTLSSKKSLLRHFESKQHKSITQNINDKQYDDDVMQYDDDDVMQCDTKQNISTKQYDIQQQSIPEQIDGLMQSIAQYTGQVYIPNRYPSCNYCNIQFETQQQLQKHLQTESHIQKAEQREENNKIIDQLVQDILQISNTTQSKAYSPFFVPQKNTVDQPFMKQLFRDYELQLQRLNIFYKALKKLNSSAQRQYRSMNQQVLSQFLDLHKMWNKIDDIVNKQLHSDMLESLGDIIEKQETMIQAKIQKLKQQQRGIINCCDIGDLLERYSTILLIKYGAVCDLADPIN